MTEESLCAAGYISLEDLVKNSIQVKIYVHIMYTKRLRDGKMGLYLSIVC